MYLSIRCKDSSSGQCLHLRRSLHTPVSWNQNPMEPLWAEWINSRTDKSQIKIRHPRHSRLNHRHGIPLDCRASPEQCPQSTFPRPLLRPKNITLYPRRLRRQGRSQVLFRGSPGRQPPRRKLFHRLYQQSLLVMIGGIPMHLWLPLEVTRS